MFSILFKTMKRYKGDSTKDYGQININCVCGKKYLSDRKRTTKCPHCGHVWNLHPEPITEDNIGSLDRSSIPLASKQLLKHNYGR